MPTSDTKPPLNDMNNPATKEYVGKVALAICVVVIAYSLIGMTMTFLATRHIEQKVSQPCQQQK